MMKKTALIMILFAVLLLLSPLAMFAQEGSATATPSVEEPAAGESPTETSPTDETPVNEAAQETPTATPPAEEATTPESSTDANLTEETAAGEVDEVVSGEGFVIDLSFEGEIICDLDVIVQIDDWLSKLSEKFYGDLLAFPAIAVATNLKAAEDDTYALIEDVDLIEPGWKLCIIGVETAQDILGFELENPPLADDTPINLIGTIKIGAAHALTGPLAEQGESIRKGIDLAVKEVNDSTFLGSALLEVLWEDTAGDKDLAVKAFNKLINEDQVVAILGPSLSRSAFVTAPLAQAAGVPVIGSSNAASGITGIGDYIFRTNLPENVIIRNTIERTKALLNLERVVLIYDTRNAFAKASHKVFEQALQEAEIEVVAVIALDDDTGDLSTQLSEIQSLGPDAVVLNVLSEEAANLILQARRLGVPDQIRFIGGNSFNSASFTEVGGIVINGTVIGTAWNVNTISGSNRQFVTNYEAQFGAKPDQFAAQSYTALWALANALRNADSTDSTLIRNALDNLELIDSPLGLFTFDDTRNPEHAPILQVVADGELVVFQ